MVFRRSGGIRGGGGARTVRLNAPLTPALSPSDGERERTHRLGNGWGEGGCVRLCGIEGKDVGLGAELVLEFLDDLGVGDAVEEHFVELVADFFWESGDFAATGAGGVCE